MQHFSKLSLLLYGLEYQCETVEGELAELKPAILLREQIHNQARIQSLDTTLFHLNDESVQPLDHQFWTLNYKGQGEEDSTFVFHQIISILAFCKELSLGLCLNLHSQNT